MQSMVHQYQCDNATIHYDKMNGVCVSGHATSILVFHVNNVVRFGCDGIGLVSFPHLGTRRSDNISAIMTDAAITPCKIFHAIFVHMHEPQHSGSGIGSQQNFRTRSCCWWRWHISMFDHHTIRARSRSRSRSRSSSSRSIFVGEPHRRGHVDIVHSHRSIVSVDEDFVLIGTRVDVHDTQLLFRARRVADDFHRVEFHEAEFALDTADVGDSAAARDAARGPCGASHFREAWPHVYPPRGLIFGHITLRRLRRIMRCLCNIPRVAACVEWNDMHGVAIERDEQGWSEREEGENFIGIGLRIAAMIHLGHLYV